MNARACRHTCHEGQVHGVFVPHVCSSAQVEGDAQVHEDEARTCESFLSFIREDTSGGVYETKTTRAKSTSNAPLDKYLRGTYYVLVRSRLWSEGRD